MVRALCCWCVPAQIMRQTRDEVSSDLRCRSHAQEAAQRWTLQDEPHASMGPEGSLAQHVNALKAGDVEAAFKFIASSVHEGTDTFSTYKDQLDSPLFRPLLSHISSQVSDHALSKRDMSSHGCA